MSAHTLVKFNLIGGLEDVTNQVLGFSSEDWRPMDTERLRKVVEYLDRQMEVNHETHNS